MADTETDHTIIGTGVDTLKFLDAPLLSSPYKRRQARGLSNPGWITRYTLAKELVHFLACNQRFFPHSHVNYGPSLPYSSLRTIYNTDKVHVLFSCLELFRKLCTTPTPSSTFQNVLHVQGMELSCEHTQTMQPVHSSI